MDMAAAAAIGPYGFPPITEKLNPFWKHPTFSYQDGVGFGNWM
jgi:hypothetical protein